MFVVLCPKRCLWGVERTNIYTFHSLDKGYWHYSRGGGTADGCFGWGVGPLVRPGQVGGGQSEPPPTHRIKGSRGPPTPIASGPSVMLSTPRLVATKVPEA
jgi:hypothetical protein